MSRSLRFFFLIYFCVQTLSPQLAFAEDPLSESGSVLPSSDLPSDPPASSVSSDSSSSESSSPSPSVHIVISEVLWMGSDVSTADEWVELTAIGDRMGPQSLSGWTLTALKGTTEAVIATFPATISIESGQSLIISNYGKDASRLSIDPLFTSTSMSLPNTKLFLRLRNSSGTLIDEVDDGIGNPFAGSNPSGGGPKASMERIDLQLPGTDPANWKTATESRGFDVGLPIFGTPGYFLSIDTSTASSSQQSSVVLQSSLSSGSSASSFSSASSLNEQINSSLIQVEPYTGPIINELLPDPIGTDTAEWIEIFNPAPQPLNLSGMTIRVNTTAHRVKGTASGLIINANSVLVLPKSVGGFTLSNNGASVSLESGALVLDRFVYPSVPEGISIGRLGADIIPFCLPTPGRPNASLPVDATLVVQSGKLTGVQPISVNLGITVRSGSLAGASCHTDYGDGYTSDSCNPATHSLQVIGEYTITLTVHDYCSNTVIQTLAGNVSPKPFSVHTKAPPTKTMLAASCTPSAFSGVTISEFLPNPAGDEAEGEWIELQNPTDDNRPLCGWSIDDGLGGSKPASLSEFQMPAHSFLVLPRKQTKVALNNDHDIARLIAPLPGGGTGVTLSVQFDDAPENQTYALDPLGNWQWTEYKTPGAENMFQEPAKAFQPSPISLSAALPNPKGVDTFDEYIELTNDAIYPIWLNGWHIRNAKGKELDLTGTVLAKKETKRIRLERLSFPLANESDTLSLIDTNHTIRSVLSWKNAPTDARETPFTPGDSTGALVRQVIDGDMLVVQMVGSGANHLETVRLLGVDAPELFDTNTDISAKGFLAKDFIRALIINKIVDLQFDTTKRDKYGRLLAYVFLDGRDIQQELLTQGFVYAYREFPVGRLQEYEVYESIARTLKAGIWSNQQLADAYDAKILEQEQWSAVREHGLSIKPDVKEGVIASGSALHLALNQSAQLYVSINRQPYTLFSGSILLASNQTIRAYAEATYEGSSIHSPVIEKTYIVDPSVSKRAIRISEAYPSPGKGESEWIELENRTNEEVSLAGWLLDDAEGGSKPYRITADVHIPAKSFLVFPKTLTNLSLNNSGDDVRLLDPSGAVIDMLTFASVKTGRAIAWNEEKNATCLTDTPTPLLSNTCFIQIKKSTQKKSIKKGTKTKSVKNKKLDILADISAKSGSGLYADLKQQVLLRNRKESFENSQSGLWQGVGIGLFLGLGLVLAWIAKEKYSLFK